MAVEVARFLCCFIVVVVGLYVKTGKHCDIGEKRQTC